MGVGKKIAKWLGSKLDLLARSYHGLQRTAAICKRKVVEGIVDLKRQLFSVMFFATVVGCALRINTHLYCVVGFVNDAMEDAEQEYLRQL